MNSAWSDRLIDGFVRKKVVELELNIANGWTGNDLSFLAKLPHLKCLEILDLVIRDIEPIHHLRKLKRLGVTTYCSTEIDFSAFPELESCGLEWRAKAKSLFDCVTLRELFVDRYKGKDADPFAKLVNLEELQILNSPIADIRALGELSSLRSLRLANFRCLISLAGLEKLKNLEALEIDTCRGVCSIDEIGSLHRLRHLHLSNDGDIASLKPLAKLKDLESITFPESTNIIDGDLSVIVNQKNLSCVSFQNRRHYSHRREEFSAYWG